MNATASPSPNGTPRPGGGLADLGVRILSALVLAAFALGALWVGGFLFAAFWTAAGIAILWEWQHLVGGEGVSTRLYAGAASVALVGGLASLGHIEAAAALIAVSALAVGWIAGAERAVWAGAGVVYASAMVLAVCVLRSSLFYGFVATLWLFAVVWTTDVMAYFGGRLIGGPKLWPRVSPGKTWSGFVVGVVSGAAVSSAIALWLTTPGEASILPLIALGLATAAVSQGGDLFESSVKRRFGAKDSSHIIPGHGGFMDRLDAFVFASIFAVIVGTLHKGAVAAAHGLLVW
ncbi:MAG: phosphatidate cytidylyltransferase [Beijerinckiaceae bacterium]